PSIQKLRVLYLCYVWCESSLYYKDRASPRVQHTYLKVLKACENLKSPEMDSIRKELKHAFESNILEFNVKRKSSINTEVEINKFLTEKSVPSEVAKLIDFISTDIKILTAQLTSNATPMDMLKERKADDTIEIEVLY